MNSRNFCCEDCHCQDYACYVTVTGTDPWSGPRTVGIYVGLGTCITYARSASLAECYSSNSVKPCE